MMAIHCPYCQQSISAKSVKAGRFTPTCPKCGQKFVLSVSEDLQEIKTAPLRTKRPQEDETSHELRIPSVTETQVLASDTQQTGAWASDGAIAATVAPPAPSERADVTGAWDSGPGSELEQTAPPEPTRAAGQETSVPDFEMGAKDYPAPTGTLGGYQLVKELGRGGMGAVYLAKQLSLDRDVALKVMKPEWASNPYFVSRFTREAYAAAQLVHHNVVQIHDIGAQGDTNFFSMELVDGENLADVVRREGKLDVELAVGYVLQAARGLKFAHDRGMIHRDIKPDNLMLNRHGIVKVADLGLVKTPASVEESSTSAQSSPGVDRQSANLTMCNTAMGTPAYMPPEQAADASKVDGRADIYSLGCTLYVLVTGQAPFKGTTVREVLSNHATQPIVPPETLVHRVPKTLSSIIQRMVAKRPEDRYANLDEVIKALEDFLGVGGTGPYSPREEHATTLEKAVGSFNDSTTAKLRSRVLPGLLGAAGLLVLLLLVLGKTLAAGAVFGLALEAALAYFVIHGITTKSHLFSKAREFAFGASWGDLFTAIVGLLLFMVSLYMLDLLWLWLGLSVVAVGLAVGLHVGLDRKALAERKPAIDQAEELLKTLRLRGVEEDALRQFVCKYSGDQWEEFYEALFGYDNKLSARSLWGRGQRGEARAKSGAWREPIVRWIDARQQARRDAKERRHLQAVEQKSLRASGVDPALAKQKAAETAAALVVTAHEIKAQAKVRPAAATMPMSQPRKPINVDELIRAAEKSVHVSVDNRRGGMIASLFNLVLGPRTRFLVGAALVATCLMWMHQNGMIPNRQLQQLAAQAIETKDVSNLKNLEIDKLKVDLTKQSRPLQLPMVPASIAKILGGFAAGLAGLILVVSSFSGSVRLGLLAIPLAVAVLLAPGFLGW